MKFIVGKRRDKKGWDVIVTVDGRIALYGPFRLHREARIAICNNRLGEPHHVEDAGA